MTTSSVTANQVAPLFVDLDGTLIATDLFSESLLLACREPLWAVQVPFWWLRGRAYLKQKLAERVSPAIHSLPYHTDVVKYLKREHAAGRPIILATASDRAWAVEVAATLGLFQDVISSDGQKNLKGARKLAAIREYCREHAFDDFAYIGDARADFPIWREAAEVYVVGPTPRMLASTRALGKPGRAFGKQTPLWRRALKALHARRWLKNLLIALPLISVAKVDANNLSHVFWAFVAFSAIASCGYVMEELFAIEFDRDTGQRRKRPFASGEIPIGTGVLLAIGLLTVGVIAPATKLPPAFAIPLFAYLFGRFCFTGIFRRRAITDAFWVAGLDTLRIIAGMLAVEAPLTAKWIVAPLVIFSGWELINWWRQVRLRNKPGTIW